MSTQLETARWNLDHLLEGLESIDAALEEVTARADAFAAAHRGALGEIDAAGLRDAMRELAAIDELIGRVASYAYLRFSTDTTDPERGALVARVQEAGTALETKLLFWELEWVALPDERAEQLLASDDLAFCRHHLRNARRYRPHLLSEAEEKIVAEKAVSGRSAWVRLFEELTSAIEVELEETLPLDVALSRLADPSRDTRRETADAVTRALEPGLRTRAYLFNTLLADKATDDRLRSYPHWLAARNLANEASDESVAALIEAVRARYELPRRWYRLKARVLGVERLADYDRMAPLFDAEQDRIEWPEACDIVERAYGDFSPALGELVEQFVRESWIDAPPAAGKRGGAFCSYTVPSVHPYVLLNYTGRRRDVLTLAHELGHGVHAALSRPQGVFHHHTPLTLMETASVFGEELTMARLLADAPSPQVRLALLAQAVEDSIATVFRQVAMNRFEDLVHSERRERGELAVERFAELWAQSQSELLGDAVEITDGYRCWWSYIPHFIGSPGYVYAYAYGQLLALSLYEKRDEEGFEERYLELLRAGGSRDPQSLGAIAGIDLGDPGFWDAGLDLLERQLSQAEAAVSELGLG